MQESWLPFSGSPRLKTWPTAATRSTRASLRRESFVRGSVIDSDTENSLDCCFCLEKLASEPGWFPEPQARIYGAAEKLRSRFDLARRGSTLVLVLENVLGENLACEPDEDQSDSTARFGQNAGTAGNAPSLSRR